MTRPERARDWQDIDGLEYSVTCFRLLAAVAKVAEQGIGSWRKTAVPDSLVAIDILVAFARDQAARQSPAFAEQRPAIPDLPTVSRHSICERPRNVRLPRPMAVPLPPVRRPVAGLRSSSAAIYCQSFQRPLCSNAASQRSVSGHP